jgi:hypothetical protein
MNAVSADVQFAAAAIWKVALASLILGAGLPTLFAVSLRALAWGEGGDAEVDHARPHPIGRVLYGVLLLVILYAIVTGILFIIASGRGGQLRFVHGLPWIGA